MPDKDDVTKWIIFGLIALIVLMVVAWVYSKIYLNKANCKNLDKLYSKFPLVRTINTSNEQFSYKLRDYYIKTAYNCCASGIFKNDFVNTCALITCIKQGARCLDFEIYSVNDEAVIAVSSVEDFTVKESYNSIPFLTAMKIIADYAFSGSTCPNPGDPLILHFRVMTKHKPIYKRMAEDLYSTLENRLLGKTYSYENNGKNLCSDPLKDFIEKVIIVVDKTNARFEHTELDEYVNIASNSIFMRSLRYHDVRYTPDMQELIDFNKKHMTIVLPDVSVNNSNISAQLAMKYGCQMIGMSFQNFDSNMEYYALFFNEAGSAFALKPANLRYIPVKIALPGPPPEEYSYKQRNTKTDYYAFSV